MSRLDLTTAPALPTAPTPGTTPVAASAWGGGRFGALFDDVRSDVSKFIEQGSDVAPPAETATSAYALQPEARSLLQALQSPSPGTGEGASSQAQQDFLSAIAPAAAEAGARLGVAPHIVAAHAALESGWGQRPLRQADGSDTHNLFGLKAGSAWQGDSTEAMTTENLGGLSVKKTERFRSYADQPAAFRDYVDLLQGDSRYRGALNTGNDAGAFAQGLARGGYATDPNYAAKLTRLAKRLQSD